MSNDEAAARLRKIVDHPDTIMPNRDEIRAILDERDKLKRDLALLRESWNAQQTTIREADHQMRELAELVDLDALAAFRERNGWGRDE